MAIWGTQSLKEGEIQSLKLQHRDAAQGSDKAINRETGTGRQRKAAQLAAACGKRGGFLVMVNMPGKKVVRNEFRLGVRRTPRTNKAEGK